MRSPAARAFAWEFGRQHRWGVLVIAVYVLFMLTTGILGIDWALTSDAGIGRFIGTIVLPLTAAVLYLLAVFSFGLSGDLAARQSMYPSRLFTLPVTTAALAGWPIVFGAVAMVVLAQAARLASWPSEVEPPFWLLLFAPVLLAWTQVVTWLSYPVRGLRVVVAVVKLITIDMIAIVAIELKPRESVMAAVLVPLLLLAWVVAYAAVRRARRGDVPDWRGAFAPTQVTRASVAETRAICLTTQRADVVRVATAWLVAARPRGLCAAIRGRPPVPRPHRAIVRDHLARGGGAHAADHGVVCRINGTEGQPGEATITDWRRSWRRARSRAPRSSPPNCV